MSGVLRSGSQRKIDHVVASLDQDESGTTARRAHRRGEPDDRSYRLAIDLLDQIALPDSRGGSVARRIDARHNEALIVSFQSVTRSHFRGERLQRESKLVVGTRAVATAALLCFRPLSIRQLTQCDLQALLATVSNHSYVRG